MASKDKNTQSLQSFKKFSQKLLDSELLYNQNRRRQSQNGLVTNHDVESPSSVGRRPATKSENVRIIQTSGPQMKGSNNLTSDLLKRREESIKGSIGVTAFNQFDDNEVKLKRINVNLINSPAIQGFTPPSSALMPSDKSPLQASTQFEATSSSVLS